MDKLLKNISLIILLVIILLSIILLSASTKKTEENPSMTELAQQITDDRVQKLSVDGNKVEITYILEDGKAEGEEEVKMTTKERDASLTETLANLGVPDDKMRALKIDIVEPSPGKVAASTILPIVLPVLLIGGLIWFMMRQAMRGNNQALSFGTSKARMIDPKDSKKKTLFTDVAGNKEAKEELSEIVDFLKAPKKFLELGAKIPKGVLLLGRPGTGKTLLAKAVAGEAEVPFFTISGSEFVEMFVGVGASRVRDLFKQAKKNAPSIVFIDEVDAVGRQRGAGLGGGNDEREQTLNQILVEMDGFESDTNVIVIAATNRPDVLDPALLRPGRFDRRVTVDLPDLSDRIAILKIHAKNKPLAKDVKIDRLAQRTPGFAGADLANLMNEGALLAGRRDSKSISMTDLVDAIEKVMLGPARKNKRMDDRETKITAYHEGGHALVGASLKNADPIHKVSIISRGSAGGYTLSVPEKDQHYHGQSYFIDQLAMLMGGFVAEKLIFGETSTGPSSDLERATSMARQYITRYGMSEMGARTFGKREEHTFLGREVSETKDFSEKTAEEIDRVVSKLVEEAKQTATEILTQKRDVLERIAQTLLKQETIEKDEFEAIIAGKEYVPEKNNEEDKKNDLDKDRKVVVEDKKVEDSDHAENKEKDA